MSSKDSTKKRQASNRGGKGKSQSHKPKGGFKEESRGGYRRGSRGGHRGGSRGGNKGNSRGGKRGNFREGPKGETRSGIGATRGVRGGFSYEISQKTSHDIEQIPIISPEVIYEEDKIESKHILSNF